MMSPQIQALEPKIRQILSAPGTDLSTISAKRVRKQLLELDPSLSPDFVKEKKDEIDDVIAKVYEQVSAANADAGGTPDDDDDDADDAASSKRKRADASDDEPAPAPAKKTKKTKTKQEKTDEELARQLQNEINGRGRSSRAGASTAKKPKANGAKRGRKPKSANIVGSDGEEAESEGEGKKKRGGGGFKKEYMLSEPLASLLGVEKLSRPQIVKQLWVHIKSNNMQNPENKKEIICDDQFRAIFKVDRIDMFKMNKELGQHLYEAQAAS